jgi:hypothetical protein
MKKMHSKQMRDQHKVKLSNCVLMCKAEKVQNQRQLFETITKKKLHSNDSTG